MSIADFYIDNCIDPSDPNGLDDYLHTQFGDDDYYSNRSARVQPTVTKPQDNSSWMGLCASDKCFQRENDTELFTSGRASDDAIVVKEIPPEYHPGALAPRFVFEAISQQAPDDTEAYIQRLLSALHGRFVCISRTGASENEKLEASDGSPWEGVRYWWRYWDTKGNVFEDTMAKCRMMNKYLARLATQGYDDYGEDEGICHDREMHGNLPGAFEKPFWLANDVDQFWDIMWCWKFEGTTLIPIWDECLANLAQTAGIGQNRSNFGSRTSASSSNMSSGGSSWPLKENLLDVDANAKGWKKVECFQPAMASYTRNDSRLNFYLSTGTVGSSLDHPTKGKTQLFRRGVNQAGSALLFDNPRTHTGKGYHTKRKQEQDAKKNLATKRIKSSDSTVLNQRRYCSVCASTKEIMEFSKNQRRKGGAGKCRQCVSGSN